MHLRISLNIVRFLRPTCRPTSSLIKPQPPALHLKMAAWPFLCPSPQLSNHVSFLKVTVHFPNCLDKDTVMPFTSCVLLSADKVHARRLQRHIQTLVHLQLKCIAEEPSPRQENCGLQLLLRIIRALVLLLSFSFHLLSFTVVVTTLHQSFLYLGLSLSIVSTLSVRVLTFASCQ